VEHTTTAGLPEWHVCGLVLLSHCIEAHAQVGAAGVGGRDGGTRVLHHACMHVGGDITVNHTCQATQQ
jgi:hypothetical protein